ncbi:uncharacterized protein LOC109796146 isoform X2 [Cajanus cajan]|uniref:uncharacterized protein LOC109796146 isoform X2 n=1 Tax=Cajanus cajan TaxID=3821 RepID=UPI00098DD59D|nr:uncharacterized protein LOC109796146 isoform X2 [Cajanus cajan]
MEEEPHNQSTPKRRKTEKKEQSSPVTEKKKKNSPAKRLTPRKSNSKNSTPKKNGSVANSPNSAWKFDLKLEAKLSAEEDSRVYAGLKIHPFFSLWKVEKKNQEEECSLIPTKREGRGVTCDSIHVFENVQDDVSPLDWSGWTFLNDTTTAEFGPTSLNLCFVESLNFDNFPDALKSSSTSISQNVMSCSDQLFKQSDNMLEISLTNSAGLANERAICPSKLEGVKDLDLEGNEINTFSGHKNIFRKSDTEPQSKFLQESMRSYYHSCESKAKSSLWIHKYKPTKAFEVCGNEEAVNFLRDWLHLWHKRRYECSKKDSSNRDSQRQDDDNHIYSDSDHASEVIDEKDSLQNVLLITGPIGSGKSAAVYACAQEQGFEILEINTSDCRKGAAVKQNLGEALKSHAVKSLLDQTLSSHKKNEQLLPAPALPNGIAVEETDDGMIEPIIISDDEAHSPGGTSPRLHGKCDVLTSDSVQSLILFEDVDILFPEDSGCIAAIRHISETAKGPIILTTNSNNAGLPVSFARLHISFSLPLPDELLCHMYMVCVMEEVNINPPLLKKFVQSCGGDIRKTIMQLQFWFQSKKYSKDRKARKVYGSLSFDLEACHQIVPKILPWNYPSDLSNLIEKEVARSITIMEENSCLQELVNKDLDINEGKNDLDEPCMKTGYSETKVERIKRSPACSEFESQYNAVYGLSNCSGFPITSSGKKDQSKVMVMASDCKVMDPNNGHTQDVHDDSYKRHSHESNSQIPCKFELNQTYPSTLFKKLVCSSLEDSEEEWYKYSDACLNETHKSFDIPCFPGSTFVPETAIQNGMKSMSGPVFGCHAGPLEVPLNNEQTPFTLGVCQSSYKLPQNSYLLENTEIHIPSLKTAVQDFRDENLETTAVCNVMDDCGHADSKLKSKIVESSPSMATDMVQNLWRELRVCQKDLGQHANPEQQGVVEVVKLTSGLTNLISEADLLFRNHQQNQNGIMEPPMSLHDEVTFSWYDEQMMMSTIAEHGFCLYAKHISDVGSKFGCKNEVDLTSEMLDCTTNVMALGKLSRQDYTKSTGIHAKKQLEMNNPTNDMKRKSLSKVIQSITPARSSLAMKGLAFNEYISSLRQISISEGSRISHGSGKMRKGRRGALHYLSRGSMMSPEDILLVCEGDLYRKISSECTANMESNGT